MSLTYDTLHTIINDKIVPQVEDNIFAEYSPVLKWMVDHSEEFEGHTMRVPLEYADAGNTQMLEAFSSISVTPAEVYTSAVYTPKLAAASLVIDKQEEIKNRTPLAIKSLVEGKMQNVEKSIAGSFARSIFKLPESTGAMSDASLFNSLPFLINDHATYSVGQISPADMPQWLSKVFTASDFTDSFTLADLADDTKDTYILKLFYALRAITKFRSRSKDILIVVPQKIWDLAAYALGERKLGSPLGEKKGVEGFDTLFFENAKIVADDHMILEQSSDADGQIYALNSDYVKWAFSPGAKFANTEFKTTQNSLTKVMNFYSMGNMITGMRNGLARISGVASPRDYVNPGTAKAIATA